MKITKRKDDTSTIRKVSDNGVALGLFGTAADLTTAGILASTKGVVQRTKMEINDGDRWVWIPAGTNPPEGQTWYGYVFETYTSRDELLEGIKYYPDAIAQ